MRGLPFFKAKNKPQFAGLNFSDGGGGGGGGGSYTLPTATASRLGGVKIGSGVNVASDGTISVDGGGGGLTPTTYTGAISGSSDEVNVDTGVTGFDFVGGFVTATYPGDGIYILPIGYNHNSSSEFCEVFVRGGTLKFKCNLSGYTDITYSVKVYGLTKGE